MEHFTDIATKSNELLMLTDEAMVEIISSDDLNVKNEEIVFESIIRWINHDPNERRQHIAKLLRCIRLGLLSTQYFVETVKVAAWRLSLLTRSYQQYCCAICTVNNFSH